MKDYFGSPLEIGDLVAVAKKNVDLDVFITAKIVAFTPQHVVISYQSKFNYDDVELLIRPSDVIKAPPGYKNS